MKNIMGMVVVVIVLVFSIQTTGYSCACGGEKTVVKNISVSQTSGETNAGNKFCPVMGGKIVDGQSVQVAHEGKIYNLCCAGCVGTFKNNPKKYINIIKSEGKRDYSGDSCNAVQSCDG